MKGYVIKYLEDTMNSKPSSKKDIMDFLKFGISWNHHIPPPRLPCRHPFSQWVLLSGSKHDVELTQTRHKCDCVVDVTYNYPNVVYNHSLTCKSIYIKRWTYA